MAISENKKFQTCVNLLYQRVTKPVDEANSVAALIRQAIIDNSLTGFLSAGELTALQNFVSDLSALAGSVVITKIENEYVNGHENDALTITGVNDNG